MIIAQVLICFAIQGVTAAYAMKTVLKPRYKVYVICLIQAVVALVCGAANIFIFPHIGAKTIIATSIHIAAFCVMFKDRAIKKIIVYFAFIAISMAIEFASMAMMHAFFGGTPMLNLFTPRYLFAVYVGTVMHVITCVIVCFIHHIVAKYEYEVITLPSLVTLVLSQALILWSCLLMFLSQDTAISAVLMALAILFSVSSNYFIIKTVADLKFKKAAKEQVKTDEILYQKRVEASKQVLQNERELSKIRHDISGHIYTMRMMAENGNNSELSNYITDLLVK